MVEARHPSASGCGADRAASMLALIGRMQASGPGPGSARCVTQSRPCRRVTPARNTPPMTPRHVLLIASILFLAGCQTPAQTTTAKPVTYTCGDGRTLQAVYPDTNSAVLTFDGQTHHLHIARSADGARYLDEHWQWWTKGLHQGRLAPLKTGEAVASDVGVACTAP